MNSFGSLIPVLFMIGAFALLFVIYRWFTTKRYPEKTEAMLDTLPDLQSVGLKRDANGYSGQYRNYPVYIYATTSLKPVGYFQGNKFQVWVLTAPQPGDLKGIGGFFGKYLVAGEKPGYAMVGFLVNFNATSTPAEDIRLKLDELIDELLKHDIKAYIL
ncbi:MAG: hypothetical protein A2W93_01650 [Bacteroidetes bacterium GWF2_43_63]|nr:MAG: hypothetical protein A2W94_10425 [Bacteroidetes bacterium GWE2_42_42]OFY55772.1 MAG: hypothetical protein A2W93_01650 [Bacteroidetes bacterium GWF2_43_63]HBG71312.1 hypothetical protein [Bacteroidales bacterium]HCB60467.1 hypothetical protein [Bacteroidales bacterium]HCY22576.1 hypothetical protein [Bacteroidales bacterium]